jgi:hypothetical protein
MKRNTLNRTQQDMNRNWNPYDSRKQTPADDRERRLDRAIVIGALLILALAAGVFCWKFATLGKATDGCSTLGIQTPTHH